MYSPHCFASKQLWARINKLNRRWQATNLIDASPCQADRRLTGRAWGWTVAIPNARLLVIPGAGHLAQGERRPDLFFPAVETFLKSGWPADARPVR